MEQQRSRHPRAAEAPGDRRRRPLAGADSGLPGVPARRRAGRAPSIRSGRSGGRTTSGIEPTGRSGSGSGSAARSGGA